jgi:NACalpha-BTF3-like transcription factor
LTIREKELASVKIRKEDVEFIANEMELTMAAADRKLRESDGNVANCLKVLLA